MKNEAASGAAESRITTEKRGHVLLIGYNRPNKMNAFDTAMLRELSAAFESMEKDDDVRCGVVFAHGEHFTAGLDLADVAPKVAEGMPLFGGESIDPGGACMASSGRSRSSSRNSRPMPHARHRVVPRAGHRGRGARYEVRPDRDQARHLPFRWRDLPARADGRMGERDAMVAHGRRVRRRRSAPHRPRSRGRRSRTGKGSRHRYR